MSALSYFFAPETCAPVLLFAETQRNGFSARKEAVGDHVVAYVRAGVGEPVLLLHGFGGNKESWVRFASHFTDNYDVVAPDLAAFGDSPALEGDKFDHDAQADRVVAFVRRLGLSKVHLVGSSMGGEIAAVIASRWPNNVKSLTLIEPAGLGPLGAPFQAAMKQQRNLLTPTSREQYEELIGRTFVKVPWIPSPVMKQNADRWISRRGLYQRVFSELHGTGAPSRLDPILPRIMAPTLLVWGAKSQFFAPEYGKAAATRLADGKFTAIPNTGHVPQLEAPAETAAVVRRFLDAHRAPPPPRGALLNPETTQPD